MPKTGWFKGNLHTHTTESDGDASPEHVADWYKDHGYDFLVLSDHNHLTVLDDADAHPGKWPLMIPGEEVTLRLFDGAAPIHVNGIGMREFIEPAREESVIETLQENINLIRAQGALASINHPNYYWAISADDIIATEGAWAVEIFNGHPGTNSHGGGGYQSVEEMWDRVLSAGKSVYGIATDDAHHYKDEFSPVLANPGRGWVVVKAASASLSALMEGMRNGEFYASSGVSIFDARAARDEIVIEMAPYATEEFTTVFRGLNGMELVTEHGQSVRYRPTGKETYVRATVYSSRGPRAWTQPLFMDG